MANIASQKKRILRSERERRENRRLTSVVKTRFRELESSVDAGDAEAINENTAARKKQRAARLVAGAGT
jgi:small subunit ribosomal protein S20